MLRCCRTVRVTADFRWTAALLLVACFALFSGTGCSGDASEPGPRETSRDFVIRFLPRYYTFRMQGNTAGRPLISPSEMSSDFRSIVSPNDDTYYASTFLDLSVEPAVLTVPDTELDFSVQLMDTMTEVLPNDIGAPGGKSYAFTGPEWSGSLPAGIERVDVPANGVIIIVRANRSLGNSDVSSEAREFVNSLGIRLLSQANDMSTYVLPPEAFSGSNKVDIEAEASQTPIVFLSSMREALENPLTLLSSTDVKLIGRFDDFFGEVTEEEAETDRNNLAGRLAAGVADAFDEINGNYMSARETPGGWMYFENIGEWGDNYTDRASVAHYFLYANVSSRAQYYYVYNDENGVPLSGIGGTAYQLRFPADGFPEAGSFWSLTAYNNDSITLIPNEEGQYNVPGYRQGLVKEADGSVVIYIQQERPAEALVTNWLPVDGNPFHLMLRVYEPEAPYGDYDPPTVKSL